MKPRIRLAATAVVLAIAGCLQNAGTVTAPMSNLWSAAAEQVESGRWETTHKLVKDVTHVAKATKTPLPADYDEFWQPYITMNQPVQGDVKSTIVKKLKEWGQ